MISRREVFRQKSVSQRRFPFKAVAAESTTLYRIANDRKVLEAAIATEWKR